MKVALFVTLSIGWKVPDVVRVVGFETKVAGDVAVDVIDIKLFKKPVITSA